MAHKTDHDSDVVTESKTREEVKRPPLYKVLIHNDNYTTREFVVDVLRNVFHHNETDATRIMLYVHHQGVGVAGVYSFEIAEMKARKSEELAREHEFPLRLTLEPEDD
ncbi:MAG: ATP-dependent Clp protease adaptor ClpS [Myxococcales bacterium]